MCIDNCDECKYKNNEIFCPIKGGIIMNTRERRIQRAKLLLIRNGYNITEVKNE